MGDESFSMMEFSSIDYSSTFIKLKDGTLRIKKYYAWDGSTVPLKKGLKWTTAILTFGFFIWDSDKYCKDASLIHDALYQIIRECKFSDTCDYRKLADDIYLRKLLLTKMPKWQANMRYKALRRFGSTKKQVIRPIYET